MNDYQANSRRQMINTGLDVLDTLNPALDYEYSVHSLYSKSSRAYGPNGIDIPTTLPKDLPSAKPLQMKRLFPKETEVEYKIGTWREMGIKQEDWNLVRKYDQLELHRLTEKFHEKGLDDRSLNIFISEYQKKRYRENLALAAYNDVLLKRAYTTLIDRKTPPSQRRKVRLVIERLNKLPHLYHRALREETTSKHVKRWLYKHTDKPEPEIVGFISPDPFEPRRFITDVVPRLSSSDSNVELGKRKRVEMEDEENTNSITETSSDTLLTDKHDTARPLGAKRRRVHAHKGN